MMERNQAHARGLIAALVGGVAATVVVLELERFAGWFPYVRVLLSFATLCASLRLLLLELARRRR
jgi:hypothetical protein